ncbi:hypothetical protein L1987_25498 [Smallanthus sonchifolius]|uniref:Uncharacterized protein n=1 Tax=Smallanthus sonchifolius TaxID=185202 RepID=A0ACB9IPX3_9ASTR|nr:hypothetical protein L1987_25498 [Smallanthus sonchifolius]
MPLPQISSSSENDSSNNASVGDFIFLSTIAQKTLIACLFYFTYKTSLCTSPLPFFVFLHLSRELVCRFFVKDG